MKVGDLVVPKNEFRESMWSHFEDQPMEWIGIIIDFDGLEPIVFWDEEYPAEIEYAHQMKVLNGSR